MLMAFPAYGAIRLTLNQIVKDGASAGRVWIGRDAAGRSLAMSSGHGHNRYDDRPQPGQERKRYEADLYPGRMPETAEDAVRGREMSVEESLKSRLDLH